MKRILALLLAISMLLAFSACEEEPEEQIEDPIETYTVTFVTNGGSAVSSCSVEAGKTAKQPANPKKEGCTFNGWYSDAKLTQAFDFKKPIQSDITLYAKWTQTPTEPTATEPPTEPPTEPTPSIGLEFTLNSDKRSYSVVGIGSCTDQDILIPSTHEGLPVTVIGDSAFYECYQLTSVIIPDSVTEICDWAFNDSNLTEITIPNSVKTIGQEAFSHTKLTSVILPSNLSGVNNGLFYNCINLTEVTIPSKITGIGFMAFWGCTKLERVNFLGTVKQWNNMVENEDIDQQWADETGEYTIYCKDGNIPKSHN